jgi:predicted GIY-YIG superfamily endonuclease
MFTVYKITNLINEKAYIGSSIRVEERWKQHIAASNNPNSPRYNYPLY